MLLPKRNLSLLLLLFSVFSKANKTKITALTLKVVNETMPNTKTRILLIIRRISSIQPVHLSKENYLHEYLHEFDCKILWPLSYLVLGFFLLDIKKEYWFVKQKRSNLFALHYSYNTLEVKVSEY
jgi:hypothetical protein